MFNKLFKIKGVEKDIFFIGLFSVFVVVFIPLILIPIERGVFTSLSDAWNNWDTRIYANIAEEGYQKTGDNRFNIVFFPLFPFLIYIFNFLFHNSVLSSLIISNLCFIALCLGFYKLLALDYKEDVSFRAVIYLIFFPTAYFFHAGYTESLFLASAIFSFYFARKGKWGLSGLFGFLASLSRTNGLLLFPVLIIEYFCQKKFNFRRFASEIKKINPEILWLALPLLGFLVYLALNYVVTGDFFTFMIYEKEHWFQQLKSPIVGLWGAFQGIYWRDAYDIIMVSWANIIFALFGLVLTVIGFWKLRISYSVFGALNWLLATSTSFSISIPRYMLILFPVFIVLALLGKNRVFNYSIILLFLFFQMIFLTNFVQYKWAF